MAQFKVGDPGFPSDEEKKRDHEESWKNYGAFVPDELRTVADQVLNSNGQNPNFFEGLSEEKKKRYVDSLREYSAVPAGDDQFKKRKELQKAMKTLLNK